MANLEAVTASNGAKIKRGKKDELEKYLQKYYVDDGVTAHVEEGNILVLYGYETLQAFPVTDGEADYDTDVTEEFLLGLAPYLAQPLIVQVISHEKCRFPLGAWEAKVHPDGRVEFNGFKFNQ